MFWDTFIGLGLFLDHMARDRFFQLRTYLHIVNNLERPNNCQDKMFKVRPLYDSIRNRALQLSLEENLCIDEQMVPFKGKLSVKQYVKGKPYPWGVKIFVLAGKSGMFYDFLIYQGKTTGIGETNLKRFGLGASVVVHLTQRLEKTGGYKLFFDNYFTSYNVLQILKKRNIYAAGTARINRFGVTSLRTDSEMKKEARGFSDQVVSKDGDIVLTKWLDNRTVVLASNFVGVGNEDYVERWDKKSKAYQKIKRSEVVRLYNQAMGGVDLLDQLIGYYRIFIKSKKWTLRLLMHAVDMALVNSWLEYRNKCHQLKVPSNKVMKLLTFRMRVAESLVISNTQKKKRTSQH